MDVVIDSYAWLPTAELTHMQQSAIKAALTITPKKFSGVPGPAPTPYPLWTEKPGFLGVPRAYFMERRKEHHNLVDQTTEGRKDLWDGPLTFVGNLRPDQQEALDKVEQTFRGGSYGGIVRAVTGWGKTVWSCAFMAKMGVPTLVIVHKEFLVNQWKERIEQFLPGTKVGIVQQDRCEYKDCGVAIGMIHSLVGDRDYGEEFWSWPGLIITDECFPAGTMIATPDGSAKPIEAFQVGDEILSAVGRDTVARTFQKTVPVSRLRLVKLEGGSEFICTDNHPVLSSTDGWIPAGTAQGHAVLTAAGCADTMRGHGHNATKDTVTLRDVRKTQFSAEGQAVLLSRLYGQVQEADGAVPSVRVVWDGASEAEAVPFLREQLSREMASETDVSAVLCSIQAHEGVASVEPLRSEGSIQQDAGTQSHAAGGSSPEGISHFEGAATPASAAGREWPGDDHASANAAGAVGYGMGSGICGSDSAAPHQPSITAVALQGGPSAPEPPSSRGSGRPEPQDSYGTAPRQQEVRVAAVLRVDSVTIPQPADFERLGWGSSGNTESVAVYNLSVVRHPSYVLHDSKVLVHNCHRIGAETWSVVPTRFKARWRLGVSATPRRKDGAEDVFFHHIGQVLYASQEQRMTPKIRRVWTEFKLVQTATLNPSLISKQLLLKFLCGNTARNKAIVEQMLLAVAAGRKPIVLSERLNHLDVLDAMFRREWAARHNDPVPSVGFYVGGQSEDALEEAAKARVIFATRQFAEEGLDIPALDTIFLTTPMSDVEQAVGRILRPKEGKKEPVVVDFRDDNVPSCAKTAVYRDKFYFSKGWK